MSDIARWARPILAVVLLDLRRWRRQPLAALTAVVLPAAVAVIVTAALGGEQRISTSWAVVDEDEGRGADVFFEQALEHPAIADIVTVERLGLAEAERALERSEVSAVVVLPPDLTSSLAAGEAPTIRVVAPRTDEIGTDLARLVVDQFSVRSWAGSAVMTSGGEPVPDEAWPVAVQVTSATGRQLDAATHYGPAIGMFFVLMALAFAVQNHVVDREREIDARLSTTGVPASSVIVGRVVAAMGIGGLSLSVTGTIMSLVFGRSWGAPVPVAVLVLAVLVAYAGMAAVLATVLRTSAQAQIATVGLGFVLALASGSLGPPGTIDRPRFALLVPTTHALDAFAELSVLGAGLGEVAVEVALLVVVGLALMAVSAQLAVRAR